MIPEGWEVRRLGEIVTYKNGRSYESHISENGEYFLITLDSISIDGKLKSDHKKINLLDNSLFQNDLVMILSDVAHGNFLGLTDVIPENKRYVLNQRVGALKNLRGINPNFLSDFINMHQAYFKMIGQGSSQQNLTKDDILNFVVLVPPLHEQQAIATALSDIDVLIASLDQLIAKKRDIKQATMQQLLTGKTRLPGFSGEWKVRKFGEVFQFLNTANNSRSDLSVNGGIKYIHYGDIHTKWRSFLDCSSDELPLIQRDKVRNMPFLEDGDLVMADASEDYEGIGISVEVKNATGKKVVAGLHTFLLRGNKEVLADGFKGFLQYLPAVKDALKKAATGISVYGISKNNVRNISICLPDISEQQAIATILSDMDAEIAALEQRRDKTRSLKQGMMQELLTGKTRLL